jgi:regulator of sigma E protease
MTISTTFLTQLFQFIFGIAVLIMLHEFGHFIVARLLKVEVEEFGIGFPPRMVKLFEAGGTVFSLNWIPLGGFVRPKGENDPDVPGGLAASSPWVRLAVLVAGPFMNIGIGIVLAIMLFHSLGAPVLGKVEVKQVAPQSPAALAGLQSGDLIVEVNNQKITSVDELQKTIYASLGKPTQLVYQRGSQTQQVTLVPRDPPPPDEGAIGIVMGNPTQPVSWLQAVPSGVNAAYDYAHNLLSLPIKIFQGQASPQDSRLVGYKGMFDIYQQIQNPLWFFMVISMSLGLFNLFPIPALDGGRIFLILPEILIRRRVPPQFENMIHLVGFAVLLLLLIYINLQDFINPIQLPK